MNRYQLRILWFAIGLGIVMLMFPPTRYGYTFFTDARIDGQQLLVQLGILALLAGGAWITAKDERLAADLLTRARDQIPRRIDPLALLAYASIVVMFVCAGGLLDAWTSTRGLRADAAVPMALIGVTALGVFLMTARHYFDSLK